MQTDQIIINDILTTYASHGDLQSPNVRVLLHGRQDSHRTRAHVTSRLVADESDIARIAIDMPGFGGSDLPSADPSRHIADYARHVSALLTKLNIRSYVLVGHSFGCRVICRGVVDGVLRPTRLVLIGAGGIETHSSAWYLPLIKGVKKIMLALGLRRLVRCLQSRLRDEDYQQAGPLTQIYLNTISEDLTPIYPSIRLPTTLIRGADDESTPLPKGQKMHELIPDSHLHVVPDVGHFVHHGPEDLSDAWIGYV